MLGEFHSSRVLAFSLCSFGSDSIVFIFLNLCSFCRVICCVASDDVFIIVQLILFWFEVESDVFGFWSVLGRYDLVAFVFLLVCRMVDFPFHFLWSLVWLTCLSISFNLPYRWVPFLFPLLTCGWVTSLVPLLYRQPQAKSSLSTSNGFYHSTLLPPKLPSLISFERKSQASLIQARIFL